MENNLIPSLTTRLGLRKGVLIAVVTALLFAFLVVVAPNVQVYILFKLLFHAVDHGYYIGCFVLSKFRLLFSHEKILWLRRDHFPFVTNALVYLLMRFIETNYIYVLRLCVFDFWMG